MHAGYQVIRYRNGAAFGAILLTVGNCQSNESKSLSIEMRRTVYHLGSALGTPLSLRLRKLINPLILPPTTS